MIEWWDKILIKLAIALALKARYKFEWTEVDQKTLGSFIANSTGGKMIAHLDCTLQTLINEAMNEGDYHLGRHKMDVAKGFALAIAAIKLSLPEPFAEQEEVKEAEVFPFWNTQSSPTIYR